MLFETPEGRFCEIDSSTINSELNAIFSKNLQEHDELRQNYVPYDEFLSQITFAYEIELIDPQTRVKEFDEIRAKLFLYDQSNKDDKFKLVVYTDKMKAKSEKAAPVESAGYIKPKYASGKNVIKSPR